MVLRLKKEIPHFLEFVNKEKEWLFLYGKNLEELQQAVEERNKEKVKRLLKKIALDENRVHRTQKRVKAITELFETEFLKSGKGKLSSLEEQLTIYDGQLLREVSQGLFGPKGNIPALAKKKPFPWIELYEKIKKVSENSVAPFLAVINEIEKEILALSREYFEQRTALANTLKNVRVTKFPAFHTPKRIVELGISISFDKIIKEFNAFGSPVRILDLGCGDGVCLKQLYNDYGGAVELYGVAVKMESLWTLGLEEYAEKITFKRFLKENIEELKEKEGFKEKIPWNPQAIHWHIGFAEKLSRMFPKNYFHFIYSYHGGLMHCRKIVKALYECSLVLKPGGIVAFDRTNWEEEDGKKITFLKHINEKESFTGRGSIASIFHFRKT